MKRSLLNIAMAAFISCFAACSEEEIIATQDGTPQEVTVMAQVPTRATTRIGVDNVPAGNQLRCILSVINNEDKSEITRIEQPVSSEATKISFSFTVGSNVDYSCLFWADYIDENASATNGKYTDKYYNTASLQAISVKVDATEPANNAKLFNNTASDAFCGVLPKNQIADAGTASITLKRPFAKLNLKPTTDDDWKDKVGTMDIEFEMPGEFNMLTGEAAGSKTSVKATGVKKEAENYFSTFLFVENPETATFNSDIKVTLTEEGSTEALPQKVINKGFTVKPNHEINGGVNLSTQDKVNVDVDINGKPEEPEDPNAPKVGQYLYADGTWGDAYNADGVQKSIGIIFADAKGKTDNSEYGKAGMTPYAYAMAITSINKSRLTIGTTGTEFTIPAEIQGEDPWNATDYNGYQYTQKNFNSVFTSYSAESQLYSKYTTWLTSNSIPETTTNLSTWYVPSARQVLDMIGLSVGFAGTKEVPAISINEAMAKSYNAMLEANADNAFSTGSVANMMSSYVTKRPTFAMVQFQTGNITDTPLQTPEFKPSNYANIRPVITIFKAAN